MIDNFQFADGVLSMTNDLINSRNVTNTSTIAIRKATLQELQHVFQTGIARKIIDIKVGRALRDSLNFESDEELSFYNKKLYKYVKTAALFMLGFGRGIIVIRHMGDDLSKPLTSINPKKISLITFSGDMVAATVPVIDLNNPRYMKPESYNVRGVEIHHSRVIDFTYVKPVEDLAPLYEYGGVSEIELIYEQLINDGIVERSSVTGLNKNSIPTIQVEGLKQLAAQKKEGDLLRYFSAMENAASIFGARLIDSKDTITSTQQTLTNLVSADTVSLRRLAMVSRIPVPYLIGESVKGLNSTGTTEKEIFQTMIEQIQEDYLLEPINQLLTVLGMTEAEFKDNQDADPNKRVEFEKTVFENADKLRSLGYDDRKYLEDYGFKLDAEQNSDEANYDKN